MVKCLNVFSNIFWKLFCNVISMRLIVWYIGTLWHSPFFHVIRVKMPWGLVISYFHSHFFWNKDYVISRLVVFLSSDCGDFLKIMRIAQRNYVFEISLYPFFKDLEKKNRNVDGCIKKSMVWIVVTN